MTSKVSSDSRANNQYMQFQYGDYSSHPNGYLFEQNLSVKELTVRRCDRYGRRVIERREPADSIGMRLDRTARLSLVGQSTAKFSFRIRAILRISLK